MLFLCCFWNTTNILFLLSLCCLLSTMHMPCYDSKWGLSGMNIVYWSLTAQGFFSTSFLTRGKRSNRNISFSEISGFVKNRCDFWYVMPFPSERHFNQCIVKTSETSVKTFNLLFRKICWYGLFYNKSYQYLEDILSTKAMDSLARLL